jgi:hypothetical protein
MMTIVGVGQRLYVVTGELPRGAANLAPARAVAGVAQPLSDTIDANHRGKRRARSGMPIRKNPAALDGVKFGRATRDHTRRQVEYAMIRRGAADALTTKHNAAGAEYIRSATLV